MSPYYSPLLIPADHSKEEYIHITPASAGWEHLNFAVRDLTSEYPWTSSTDEYEMAIVVLGGSAGSS